MADPLNWPKNTEGGGWTISPTFLREIAHEVEHADEFGWTCCMEAAEAVLLIATRKLSELEQNDG